MLHQENKQLEEMQSQLFKGMCELKKENERLKKWIDDLQSGMHVNCVYCGHRYCPNSHTPVSAADILKQHVENCPEHPMSKLKKENEELKRKKDLYDDLMQLLKRWKYAHVGKEYDAVREDMNAFYYARLNEDG